MGSGRGERENWTRMSSGRFTRWSTVVAGVCLLSPCLCTPCTGESVAGGATGQPRYGHKDFYPSQGRPLGYRADGNGCYPGALVVTSWRIGELKPGTVEVYSGSRQALGKKRNPKTPMQSIVLAPAETDPKTGVRSDAQNIVWRSLLPGTTDAHPIVIGDRVITCCQPDWVVCHDAHTGKELWRDRLGAMTCGKEAGTPEEAARKQTLLDIAMTCFYMRGIVTGWSSSDPLITKAIDRAKELKVKAEATGVATAETLVSLDRLAKAFEAYREGDAKRIEQAIKTLRIVPSEWRVPTKVHYNGYISSAPNTPVTDGEYVYVTFFQMQVGCYDLNGKRVWTHRFPHGNSPSMFRWKNPLLCGDLLLVRMAKGGHLAAMDKRTGEVRWTFTDCNNRTWTTPKQYSLRLPDGESLDVLMTLAGPILRVEDGAVVGEIERTLQVTTGHGKPVKESAGSGHGGRVGMMHPSGDGSALAFVNYGHETHRNSTGPVRVFRLRAVSRDKVDVKIEHEIKARNPDGSIRKVCKGKGGRTCDCSGFRVYDIGDPSKVKLVSEKNILGGVGPFPSVIMDTYLSDFPRWAFRGENRPLPFHMGNRTGGAAASGNRLFIQTAEALYCIGDPNVPYDWNPASRPARISAMLKPTSGGE